MYELKCNDDRTIRRRRRHWECVNTEEYSQETFLVSSFPTEAYRNDSFFLGGCIYIVYECQMINNNVFIFDSTISDSRYKFFPPPKKSLFGKLILHHIGRVISCRGLVQVFLLLVEADL